MRDAYAGGRTVDPFAPGYKRMAATIYYEKVRRHTGTVVEYLERYWPADHDSEQYRALYTMSSTLDASLEATYRQYGQAGVDWVLNTDPNAEATLNLLASEWHLLTHGDVAGASRMRGIQPPGASDMAPEWAVSDALAASKALYSEAERGQAGWGKEGTLRQRFLTKGPRAKKASGDPAARPKDPKAKAKPKGGAAGGGTPPVAKPH